MFLMPTAVALQAYVVVAGEPAPVHPCPGCSCAGGCGPHEDDASPPPTADRPEAVR